MTPHIAGIGTALPSYVVDQAAVKNVVQALFPDLPSTLVHVLETFSHDHIKTRHFVRPLSWYGEQHGFGQTNDAFIEDGAALATIAAQRALDQANLTAQDIDTVIVASTTGLATPSLDSIVALRLGCKPSIARMPLVGLGCAAGVSGLARAAEICIARNGRPVLFIAVEICSVTMQRSDISKSNLVGSSLFGDGAAAVVLSAAGQGPAVTGSWSHLFDGTQDIMGWEVIDTGLKVRFSRDIPTFVLSRIGAVMSDAIASWGITMDDVDLLIPHPGGAKVLDAYAQLLERPSSMFDIARDVLATCGNMSSVTVLFVLDRTLRQWPTGAKRALMTALGPGFSSEFVLLEHSQQD